MPIRTILSVLPACESGNAGVGLVLPGVGDRVAVTGNVAVAVFAVCGLAVGLILRGVPVTPVVARCVEVSLVLPAVGVGLWETGAVGVGPRERGPGGTNATLERATKSTMMARMGRRSLLIISD